VSERSGSGCSRTPGPTVSSDSLVVHPRSAAWIDLLRAATDAAPTWLVYKNVESALTGTGDIDAVASSHDFPAISTVVLSWAERFQLWPVFVCNHFPAGPNFVAVPPGELALWEFSVKERKVFRGGPLLSAAELLPMAQADDRGFRRLRPGAEGVLKLLTNGTRWAGRRNAEGLAAKEIRQLLARDPEGVAQAAGMYGSAELAVRGLASAVVAGQWNAGAALFVEGRQLLVAASRPRQTVRRAWYRSVGERRCPLIEVIHHHGRRIPPDRERWLHQVSDTHIIHRDAMTRNGVT
jgi:hypothetical protein